MRDDWRLVTTPAAHGAWNMAVDEALLEAVGRGESPATLRLYDWEPPCLSLGYAQPLADVDLLRLQEHGWELVRRPTGGRAILHTDELTYSVIAPLHEPRVEGGVLKSYSRLASALMEAFRLLDLPVEINDQEVTKTRIPNPVCFEVPSTSEITVNGKKLVGSAQARRKESILQHGSVPLTGDLSRIVQVLVFPSDKARMLAAERLLQRATTVETALGKVVSWSEAAQVFTAAFNSVLDISLQPGELSSQEKIRSGQLSAKKYAFPDWNQNQRS
jgi:lipoate-protein ligase A